MHHNHDGCMFCVGSVCTDVRHCHVGSGLKNAPVKSFTAMAMAAADLVHHSATSLVAPLASTVTSGAAGSAHPCVVSCASAATVAVQLFAELAAVLLARVRGEAVLDVGATVLDAVERAHHVGASHALSHALSLASHVHTVAQIMLVAAATTSGHLSASAQAAVVASCHAAMDRAPVLAVCGVVAAVQDRMDQVVCGVGVQSITAVMAEVAAVDESTLSARAGAVQCAPSVLAVVVYTRESHGMRVSARALNVHSGVCVEQAWTTPCACRRLRACTLLTGG